MSIVFIAFLTGGLVLGVYAMLYGTERSPRRSAAPIAPHERRSEHDPAAEPSSVFNLASIAAFAVGAGMCGYLMLRYGSFSSAVVLLLAFVAGALFMALQSLLIARWAIPGARAEHVDERYLLQGTIGRVITPIPDGGVGEIRYALDSGEYSLPARLVDSGTLASGDDIVIERIEDGVAFVERWTQVEQRL